MENSTKKHIVIQVITSIIFGLVVGILGLLSGATYGGNFGFPEYFGLPGYEGSGLFGFYSGALLGIWLAVVTVGAIRKATGSTLRSALVIISIWLMLIIFGFSMEYVGVIGGFEVSYLLLFVLFIIAIPSVIWAWHSEHRA